MYQRANWLAGFAEVFEGTGLVSTILSNVKLTFGQSTGQCTNRLKAEMLLLHLAPLTVDTASRVENAFDKYLSNSIPSTRPTKLHSD